MSDKNTSIFMSDKNTSKRRKINLEVSIDKDLLQEKLSNIKNLVKKELNSISDVIKIK